MDSFRDMVPSTLANGDLRHKRIETHRMFDAIWKNGILSRKEAYRWMQDIFAYLKVPFFQNGAFLPCPCFMYGLSNL